jgi:hypothetical protein
MKSGYDLSRLIKFTLREDWRDALEDAMADHVGLAQEEFCVEFEEIGDILGDHYEGLLFGCALEDLMTRRFEPDGINLVDDYLKRQGWNETAPAKAYMRALRDSVCSLYEVSDVIPGQSFLARDLVRGGEPIRVTERTATRTLKQWDKISARIVPERKGHVLSGALLPFSVEGAGTLLTGLHKAEGKRRKSGPLDIDDETLATIAHLFTTGWLYDVLPKALGLQQPAIRNSDGDELVFHKVRFRLAKSASPADVAAQINGYPEFSRENDHFWNWLKTSTGSLPRAKATGTLAMSTTMDNGQTVYGTVEIKGRALVLAVNSAKRAQEGIMLIMSLVGSMVGKPLTEIETVEQAMRNQGPSEREESPVSLEIATQIIHQTMDRHYRETLDQPVGALNDQTPREAAKTAKGRKMLVNWLKFIENNSGRQANPNDPMATYDFSWLWTELGVEKLRK